MISLSHIIQINPAKDASVGKVNDRLKTGKEEAIPDSQHIIVLKGA